MFSRDSLDKGIKQVNEAEPDVVIITGDLTDWGLKFEFEGVQKLLEEINAPYLTVAGNHDARHTGYVLYEKMFCKKTGKRYYSKKMDDYILYGLDSAEPDLDTGHLGRDQLDWLERRLKKNDKLPIIFLHHHVIPVPNVGRERNVLVDAGSALELFNRHDLPLILTGHKHYPWHWKLNGMVIANVGTISCERRCHPTSFNFIELKKDKIKIKRQLVMEGKLEKVGEFKI